MFDARKALRHLSGKRFAYKELRDELGKVRVENLSNLPVEFGIHEIFDLLWRERWIREDADGLLALRIPKPNKRGVFDAVAGLWLLSGRCLDSVELQRVLERIIADNLRDIPAEFKAKDYRELAIKEGWIVKVSENRYVVSVP